MGAWAVLLQLAVVLVGGSPRAVVMFSRGRGVKEGRQIRMSLSGHAAENKAQHRNIPSNAKQCEIVVKKRLAPGKAELPNKGFLRFVERLQDRCSCMVKAPCVQLQNPKDVGVLLRNHACGGIERPRPQKSSDFGPGPRNDF